VSEAVRTIGGDPEELNDSYSVEISEDGCDYVFFAQAVEPWAVEPVSIRISRLGEVKSFPWCCGLGHCPELCAEGEPTDTN